MERQPRSHDAGDGGGAANFDAGESRKRPRQDDVDATHQPPPAAAPASKLPAPKYGSKAYWEARYKSHLLQGKDEGGREGCVLDGVVLSKEATKAGHQWYFTYDELRPLIMPLILGEDDNEVVEGEYDEDEESWVEEEGEGEWVDVGEASDGDDNDKEEGAPDKDARETAASDKESPNSEGHELQPRSAGDNAQEGDKEEVDHSTEMLDSSRHRPKRILEIGCGDKPLGTPLAADMNSMQSGTGIEVTAIVDEITCVDYSEVVVQSLIEEQKRDEAQPTKKDGEQQPCQSANELRPTFRALDARRLPLPSDSYDIILEKGTLDAMLSDEAEGLTNCVQIVKEMARVTNEGGAILIVSHLNANEPKGMGWLEDVVFRGLKEEFEDRQQIKSEKRQKKSGDNSEESANAPDATVDEEREYVWSVEVHGGDGKFFDANGDEVKPEDVDEDAVPIYGPAVYIAKKKGVPASIARELCGKKIKREEGDKDDDDDTDGGMMEMPPVRLEYLTY